MMPASIVRIYDQTLGDVLYKQADEVILNVEGLTEARFIAEQMLATIQPLMPAAGLAAPQIGYSKRLFLWSWNRTMEEMDTAVNPVIIHSTNEQVGWEACLSALQDEGECQAAQLLRAHTISVEYYNLRGELIKQQLTGFAAKVFQHEYDHLQGIVCVRKTQAVVKSFPTSADLKSFMMTVKKEDSLTYTRPETLV